MQNLFTTYDLEAMEKFEIIFDRATNEKTAKQNAVSYYKSLIDENEEADIDEIIDLAESYGYNFDDFETLVESE
jgi:hypothetical protein